MSANYPDIFRNNVASRMFRDVADMDYVSARTLFRNDCLDEFLIFSQQVLEKYLKGILLFNKVKNVKSTHSLSRLLRLCDANVDHFKISDQTRDFIDKIDGAEALRYAPYILGGFSADRDYLLKLDYAVMDIRRYCHADLKLAVGLSKISEEDLLKYNKDVGVSFVYLLEKIRIGKDKKYKKFRENLLWKNLCFSKNIKSIQFQNGWWAKGSGFNPEELSEVYKAVREYIFIPKEVKDYFEKNEK